MKGSQPGNKSKKLTGYFDDAESPYALTLLGQRVAGGGSLYFTISLSIRFSVRLTFAYGGTLKSAWNQ